MSMEPAASGRAAGSPGTEHVPRRAIWSWMMFDWATQPFNTLILTFVFGPYFTSVALTNESAAAFLDAVGLGFLFDPTNAEGDAGPQAVWGLIAGVTGMFTALAAPVLGAMADATGPRKPWIAAFSVLAIVGSIGLWALTPGAETDAILLVALCFALAYFGFEFATVFNNAMMPDLVPRAQLGRLSGNAWALGYVGGLVSLVIVLGFLSTQPGEGRTLLGLEPLFGLDPEAGEGNRATGPLTGLWYALFVLPLFVFVPDAPKRAAVKGAVADGLRRLRTTLRTLPRQRSLFAYLGSSMFYRDALNGLYTFGGIYAAGILGWSIILLGVFGIITALVGAIGAWIGGKLDARFGPKPVVAACVVALLLVTLVITATDRSSVLLLPVGDVVPSIEVTLPLLGPLGTPDLVFLACGMVIGAAGGSLQAASRTLLVDQAHPDRMTEAFGLYALSGKATSFLAPVMVGLLTALFASQRAGMLALAVLFLAGLALLPLVRQRDPD